MNVLLIGGSNGLLNQIIKKMNKEGHRVSILTGSRFRMEKYERVFERYDFSYDAVNLPEVFTSVSPDVTIFMGAFDSSFRWSNDQGESVRFISGLMSVLIAFSTLRRGRFLFLSSELVFNGASRRAYTADDNGNAVDYRGLAIAQGEELCESFRLNRGLDIVTVRLGGYYYVPHTRGQIDNTVARMCFEALTERRIHVLPEYTVSLLHDSDAVQFISQLASAPNHARGRYQLSSGELLTQQELAEMVRDAFWVAEKEQLKGHPTQDIQLIVDKTASPGSCALENTEFRDEFGINRVRDAQNSIDEIAAYMLRHEAVFCQDLEEAVPWFTRLRRKLVEIVGNLLPFIENLICFALFFLLGNLAMGSRYFSGVDFFLFYVLLFAIVHGQQQAALSAILATAGYLFRCIYQNSGYDVLVDYNTYIWIAQIFVVGLAVGYMKDQLHMQRSESKEERSYLAEQIDDIKEINSSNVRVKDAMQTQIINQSDSIGKIYEITSTLNQYSFEEVLFYATEILERVMDSQDIAIYTVDNSTYARLFTATSQAARALGNSVKYVEITEIYEDISKHRVYINRKLDDHLPMMVSAIFEGDEIRMLLMIWKLPWEKMTLGQANLLAVTGALIQNAALRASRYLEALRSERFLGDTPILKAKEFKELVQAYLSARDRSLTTFSLLAIEMAIPPELSPQDGEGAPALPEEDDTAEKKQTGARRLVAAGTKQTEAIDHQLRPHDYLGEGEDGRMYALLTNTDASGAKIVMERMSRSGVPCQIVDRLA